MKIAVRIWGGQVVEADLLRQFLFMRLCLYAQEYSEGMSPRHIAKWYPSWRVYRLAKPKPKETK